MEANVETSKAPAEPVTPAMSTQDAISIFNKMVPSEEVVMRSEMEEMFPSIRSAIQRGVSEKQIITELRKKWPTAHVATIIKLLNSELERCVRRGEHIECPPFGSPRKAKTYLTAAKVEPDQAANLSEGRVSP